MNFAPGPGLTSLCPSHTPLAPISRITPISLELWRAHLHTAAPHATLPDGTPLRLTASGIDLFERLTAGSFIPQDFHEASVLLWCATRTSDELETLWIPAPPEDTDPAPDSASLIPIYNISGIMRRVVRWRDTTIPAGARTEAHGLALALWNHEHGTLLEVDEAGLPDTPDSEKKSPPVAPTGSSPPSTPSPEETPPAGPISFTASPTAPSSPPTEHGSSPTASPSSPPQPETAGTDSSTPSSPFPHAHPAATCDFCIPGVDNCPHPQDSGQPFWVAELIGFHLYAEKSGCFTSDIHAAPHFPNEESCQAWIRTFTCPQDWVARDHLCL